jgi:hypothetical protein
MKLTVKDVVMCVFGAYRPIVIGNEKHMVLKNAVLSTDGFRIISGDIDFPRYYSSLCITAQMFGMNMKLHTADQYFDEPDLNKCKFVWETDNSLYWFQNINLNSSMPEIKMTVLEAESLYLKKHKKMASFAKSKKSRPQVKSKNKKVK